MSEQNGGASAPLEEFVPAHPGGRPRFIQTPDEFDGLVEGYRRLCIDEERPITMAGLAWHMGFASRQSMYDYGRRFPEFAYSVKRARLMLEEGYETRLAAGRQNPAGPIFALKQMAWTDRIAVEESGPGGGPIQHEVNSDPRDKIARRVAGLAARVGANGGHPGANGNGGAGA